MKKDSFSERLKKALIQKGYCSRNSKTGVQASPLAQHLNISYQMVQKYLTSKSCPDISTISKIAKFLDVSPGWLSFGENTLNREQYYNFFIKKEFIQKIFKGIFIDIKNIQFEKKEFIYICDFLYGIINDIAQLEATDEMKHRLIKTAISSAHINSFNKKVLTNDTSRVS